MIGLGSSALKIYLAVEPCDMRMGFNGLATAATEQLAQALAPDAVFAFVNKRHTRIKLLCSSFPRWSPPIPTPTRKSARNTTTNWT